MNDTLPSVSSSKLTMPHQQASLAATSQPIYNIPGFKSEKLFQGRTENESMSMAATIEVSIGAQSVCDGHTQATPAPQSKSGSATPASADRKGIVPEIQNVVSSVNLGCELDPKKIAQQARNVEYNPKKISAAVMRMHHPNVTAMIYKSGKMVCTGARSERESKLAARKFARIVQKLGYQVRFLDFEIQNVVAKCDVHFPIMLPKMVEVDDKTMCSYEPEIFPALKYRMVEPRVMLLIFASGKVVLTGAKCRQDIYEAFGKIYPILEGLKKYNI